MTFNIVCSDTYIDAFSKLDKKIQKKSLETIRLMRHSLKSEGLKIENLNTKLNFKSARVSQDFRIIFTQSGNTVLLVYIDHHDKTYLWANRRLQDFDASGAKSAYEYFEQSKKEMPDFEKNEHTDRYENNVSVEPPCHISLNAHTNTSAKHTAPPVSSLSENDTIPVRQNKFYKRTVALVFVGCLLGFALGVIASSLYYM